MVNQTADSANLQLRKVVNGTSSGLRAVRRFKAMQITQTVLAAVSGLRK
jgi:hypothetical protein